MGTYLVISKIKRESSIGYPTIDSRFIYYLYIWLLLIDIIQSRFLL
ncbi:MAG: hypothetical protein ACI32O_01615 [Enterococcus sp.]